MCWVVYQSSECISINLMFFSLYVVHSQARHDIQQVEENPPRPIVPENPSLCQVQRLPSLLPGVEFWR